MSQRELLKALIDFFEREKKDYALIGAFAMYGYGYARSTKDVDVLTHRDNQDGAIGFLSDLGFDTIHRSDAFSNHVHPVGSARVDLMYVSGPTAREMFASTREATVLDEIKVRVVSPEHLVALKLFAAQCNPDRLFKELADVGELVSRTDVDRSIVREYFRKYDLEPYYGRLFGKDTQGH